MNQEIELEQILQNWIIRTDTKVMVMNPETGDWVKERIEDVNLQIEEWRYRTIEEFSIEKWTRYATGISSEDRILVEPDLTEKERLAFAYITEKRKLLMAAYLGQASKGIIERFSDLEKWESVGIENHQEFLRFFINTHLDGGDKLYDPAKKYDVEYETELGQTVKKTYKIGKILKTFISELGAGKKDARAKSIMGKAINYPHHMLAWYKKSWDKSKNQIVAVVTRIKNSLSEDFKHALYWAKDEQDLESIATWLSYAQEFAGEMDQFGSVYDWAEYVNKTVEIDNTTHGKEFAAQRARALEFADVNIKAARDHRFKGLPRLSELLNRWYYGIGDSGGITIYLSQDVKKKLYGRNAGDIVKGYFQDNPLFNLVLGSDDNHVNDPKKPNELQFKVKLDQDYLVSLLEEWGASEFYKEVVMPDTMEIMVIGASAAIKYIAPGISAVEYKERQEREAVRLSRFFNPIFKIIKSISPVRGTVRASDIRDYENALVGNLMFASPDSAVNTTKFGYDLTENQQSFFQYLVT
jgi:hypothetical protein